MKAIKNKILSKRTLYFVCFLFLNMIDYLRNTQNGDVWSMAVNATGLVVMVLLFSVYPIKKFLTKQNCIWSVLCGAIFLYIMLQKEHFLFGIYKGTLALAVLNVWWILILAHYLFSKLWKEKSLTVHLDFLGDLLFFWLF